MGHWIVTAIALATVLFIGYLKPPHKQFVDAALEHRVRNYIVALVLITVVPSIYLAYNMVTDIAFNSRAQNFITSELVSDNTLVIRQKISPDTKEIEVTIIGNEIGKEQLATIREHLKYYMLANVKLVVHQRSDDKIDLASLKTSLLSDLYSTNLKTGETKDKQIQTLEDALTQLKAEQPDSQSIARELHTQYPMLLHVGLAKTPVWNADGSAAENSLIAYLVVTRPISGADKKKIIAWLSVRTKMEHVRLIVSKS